MDSPLLSAVLAFAPLFYPFIFFVFINRWLNEGKLPLTVSLPPVEMAFLVRCYANCLQPWSSKVSDVVILFLASASGIACCVWVCACVCARTLVHACVCLRACWKWEIGCGWKSLNLIYISVMNIYEYLSTEHNPVLLITLYLYPLSLLIVYIGNLVYLFPALVLKVTFHYLHLLLQSINI